MNTTTNRAADNIRILAASMVEKAKSGHPGGAMGGADYINVLYSEFLNFDPDDGEWVNRDRFFLDPGHMSPMLYATLSLIGKYSMEDLKNFRQCREYFRSSGSGTCHGRRSSYRRTFSGSPFR